MSTKSVAALGRMVKIKAPATALTAPGCGRTGLESDMPKGTCRSGRDKTRLCTIDGCERVYWTRGVCNMHYRRLKKEGVLKPIVRPTAEERFWSKVDKTETCWNWTGSILSDGYGMFNFKLKNVLAHRHSYKTNVGVIPEGKTVDHICRNRRCVRPGHLRLATQKENAENHGGPNRNNKCGVWGVHWQEDRQRFHAQVGHNGKIHHVGDFRVLADAAEAVRLKRIELFTHNDVDRKI